MADRKDFDGENVVMDKAENAIIPNPVSPLSCPILRQPLALRIRVRCSLKVSLNPSDDERRIEPIHLLELFQGSRGVFNRIGQFSPSSFMTSS